MVRALSCLGFTFKQRPKTPTASSLLPPMARAAPR
eukprot:CAMPEP_0183467892 /NCGR_PEP_ID=MMETSP0370-20130417/151771_1 /TAXON_ID=268820 /ORGANISM="Peridinium aciculiferum, Strain PAER-2" /LENGTH=34 /DNA_ID= /DNA_START= /DNA_END= /DNA_ORIENTATION=